MGIFILIAGTIMVIAGVVTLIGLYRLNRFRFDDQPSYLLVRNPLKIKAK